MPLEGGLYQWAKQGFGEMAGFLIAWNLWVYAVVVMGAIIFVVPTDLAYMLGQRVEVAAGQPVGDARDHRRARDGGASRWSRCCGLNIGKWLHNAGSVMILTAYVILLGLPVWAMAHGSTHPLRGATVASCRR